MADRAAEAEWRSVRFGRRSRTAAHFYAHAQGTIVLCEALALTEAGGELAPSTLRSAAKKAVKFLIDAQNPRLGGWKYRPLDVDGLGTCRSPAGADGLHSARMAKIEVPQETSCWLRRFWTRRRSTSRMDRVNRYRPDEPSQKEQLLVDVG